MYTSLPYKYDGFLPYPFDENMRTKPTASYRVTPGPSRQTRAPHDSPKLQEMMSLRKNNNAVPIVNPQSACSLLQRIPREIREQIYTMAVTTYEDPTRPFDPSEYNNKSACFVIPEDKGWPKFRIGRQQHHRSTCIALLKTCKRIYSEARLLPVSVNEHCIRYLKPQIISRPLPTKGVEYFNRLTPEQLAAVQHVHIFTDVSLLSAYDPGTYRSETAWAELGFLRWGGGEGYRPQAADRQYHMKGPFPTFFTITVCFNDWGLAGYPYVGLEDMLRNLHWENVLGGVKVFKIELEKFAADKASLDLEIKRLLRTDFYIGNGEVLVPDCGASSYKWTSEMDQGPYGRPDWKDTDFFGMSVTWRVRKWDDSREYSFLSQ
jgi:hypothetical protein